ncbi:MAG: BatA domain-containing protein [Planctomycetes bacterium]|nr:BatA domain-containing protein [Planctomycetota bacterium]
MLESFFAHPLLLAALVAAGLPWLIEWLFRRRKRQVELPTLRYILQDKEQEQVKRQDRILLILRTLAVALLVLGVARPVLQHGLLGSASERHVVVLLDATASMNQRVGVTTSFGIAQKKAAAMVRALPAETTVSVVTMGDRAETVLDAETDLHTAGGRIEALRPGSGAGPMADALQWVKDYVEQSKWDKAEVYAFSDFQKFTWQPPGGKAEGLSRGLRELGERCELFMVDVGGTPTFNYLVTSLRPTERLISAGRPVNFTVQVASTGKVPQDRAARVLFLVDGEKKGVRELSPGGEGGTLNFEHRFASAGEYLVEVQLEGDEHPVDNRRFYLCQVPEEIKVLLVDEQAGAAGSDTYFLAKAIDPLRRPGLDRVSPFSVKVIAPAQLAYENLEPYRALALAALGSVDEAFAARLERYVADGGAAWFFLGPRANPYDYNKHLYKEGRGLLPAKVGDAPISLATAPHLVFAGATHPALSELQGSAGKDHAKVTGCIPLTVSPTEADVVATLSDGTPALVRRDWGRGQVVLANYTAGPEWTILPALPEFPILAQGMLKHLAGDADASVNLNAGDRFQSAVYVSAQHLLLKRPDGGKERLTPRKKEGEEEAWNIAYENTNLDGEYFFTEVPKEVLARRRFVVNPRTEEGDLARLQEDEFGDLFGSAGYSWLSPEQSIEEFVAKLHSVTELAPLVLVILALMMGSESFLAVRYGMRRTEDAA